LTIGGYEVQEIETGTFRLDGGAMFGVVPKPLWERTSSADARNRITLASRCMLLRGNGRVVLVDTGNGTKYNEKMSDVFSIDVTQNALLRSLARVGVSPDGVTDVILTHLHFDHAGGATVRSNGRIEPTFPRARYSVQRSQWDAAHGPTERDRASFLSDDFDPLMEAGVLDLVEGECEILPGINVLLFFGHTTALQCPVLSDGQQTILFCADLIPLREHVQLPWIMGYDLRPLVTLEEKRHILRRAVDERWLLFFQHDPETAVATVTNDARGYHAGPRVLL
jgi:glyoxylase-like metal-dependent hydrolase (beta-lactamase superfamily II)